jgi:CHAD domain-containing protein
VYRHTNETLRDVARLLSQARDADVLNQALHKLLRRAGGPPGGVDVKKVEKLLLRERSRAKQSVQMRGQLASLRDALSAIRKGAQRWNLKGQNSSVVFSATRRSYSRVRKTRRIASDHRSTNDLHEWRKQTKYLWHQIQVLEPLAPGELGSYADALHRLADYLGDDHDLAVLRSTLFGSQALLADKCGVLEALIDKRRAALQVRAFASAETLLQQRPRRWRTTLKGYWKGQKQRRRDAVRVAEDEQGDGLAHKFQSARHSEGTASPRH